MNKVKYNVGDKVKYINSAGYVRIGTIIKKAGLFKIKYTVEYQSLFDTYADETNEKNIICIVK